MAAHSMLVNTIGKNARDACMKIFKETIVDLNKSWNMVLDEHMEEIIAEFNRRVENTDTIVQCEEITQLCNKNTIKSVKKKNTPPPGAFSLCHCRARVYGSGDNKGLGPQCSRKRIDGTEYCTKHNKERDQHNGKTHFGNFDEDRPEFTLIEGNPCGWKDGTRISNTKKSNKKNSSPKKSSKKSDLPEEIQALKKQYTALLGKAPRGPNANKQEWLEQKISEAQQNSVKETVDELCNHVESLTLPPQQLEEDNTEIHDDGAGTGLNLFSKDDSDSEEEEDDEELVMVADKDGNMKEYMWDKETKMLLDEGKCVGTYNEGIVEWKA
jgi:hypothetical protein